METKLNREDGQGLVEIGIILALVVMVSMLGLTVFAGAIDGLWTERVAQAVVAL